MAKVNFQAGTLSQYTGLTSRNENTLYFITDAKKIYKGDIDVTSAVEIVTSFDGTAGSGNINLADAVGGKFYVNATTFEMRVKSGSAWVVLSPGYISAGGNWAQADDDAKLGTIGVIKTIIGQAMATINPSISYDNSTGTLTVGENTARLTGVINGITYNSEQLQIQVSSVASDGSPTVQTISLPKDNFVRSGYYDPEAQLPNPPGGTGPAIVLVVGDGTEEGSTQNIVIPASSLVDVYTGTSTNSIQVTVSESNQISATAIIDPVEGNALVSSASGLKVDISGKADKLTSAANTHILIGNATGNLADSGVTINSSGALGSSTTQVPTASVIAAAITAATTLTQGTLQEVINSIEGDITDLNEALAIKLNAVAGVENNFVAFSTDSAIKDSGYSAGGSTLSGDASSQVLATEAAVEAALSWTMLE